MTMHAHTETHTDLEHCIRQCEECHHICLMTVNHCLEMGGKHADPAHIRLLLSCAEICQTSANFMLLSSAQHGLTCGVCAEVCERCAEDCLNIDPDDAKMKACAQACLSCAESCRQMAHDAMRNLMN
jgi:hypothetical protein